LDDLCDQQVSTGDTYLEYSHTLNHGRVNKV
jgi:hypothetical protein